MNKAHKTKIDLAIEGKSNASTRAFTAAEKERTKVNSIFLSTTDRFAKLEASNPHVRILNPEKKKTSVEPALDNTLTQPVSVVPATDKVQYDFKDTRTEWRFQARASDYHIYSGKNIAFDQTSPRFNYN